MKNVAWIEGERVMDHAVRLGWSGKSGIASPAEWMAAEIERLRSRNEFLTEQPVKAWNEVTRLRAEVTYQTATAAYYEHDSQCCGGCPECGKLYETMNSAKKARHTDPNGEPRKPPERSDCRPDERDMIWTPPTS